MKAWLKHRQEEPVKRLISRPKRELVSGHTVVPVYGDHSNETRCTVPS
jgi:hypothetical protein